MCLSLSLSLYIYICIYIYIYIYNTNIIHIIIIIIIIMCCTCNISRYSLSPPRTSGFPQVEEDAGKQRGEETWWQELGGGG